MHQISALPIERLIVPFNVGPRSADNVSANLEQDGSSIKKLTSSPSPTVDGTTVGEQNTVAVNDHESTSVISLDRAIWRPSAQSVRDSVLSKFIEFLNEQPAKSFYNGKPSFQKHMNNPEMLHRALHEWSVSEEWFWGFVWDFLEIKCSKSYDRVKYTPPIHRENGSLSTQFVDTKFFVGAKMNYAENMLRMCQVDSFKDKDAFVFIGENNIPSVESCRQSITYGQLWEKVAKLSHYLRTKVGLRKMDRVVALLPNCIETIVALLAVTSIGAVWSSVSPDLGKKIISDRFKQIQPTLLFTCEYYTFNGKVHCTNETTEYLISHLPSLKSVVGVQLLRFSDPTIAEKNPKLIDIVHKKNQKSVSSRMKRGHDLEYLDLQKDILEQYLTIPRLEFEQVSAQHPIFIMYTSGTTGKPKCICQGFGVLVNHLKETHMHCDVTSKDTVFVYTNAGWMMWNWMVSMCCLGATLILYDGSPLFPNETAMWDLIERENVTFFGTSARYLSHMATSGVDLIRKKPTNLSKLRLITSTGSPLAASTAMYVYKHLAPHVHLSSMSGGTDLNGCFAIGSPFLPVYPAELQCAGLGMNVQVFSDSGERIFGQDGELVCLNPFPSAPLFFWGEEDHKRYLDSYFTTFPGIWAQGDLAEQTKRFGYYVKGRSDSTLNPGGVRIGTGDYYDILQYVEEVQDSVVVGQRQPDGNERVILFVQLKGGHMINKSLIDKIQTTIRNHLSARHRPSIIAQVSGVPVNVNGKKMEKLVKKLCNADPVAPSEISSLKNPECMPEF